MALNHKLTDKMIAEIKRIIDENFWDQISSERLLGEIEYHLRVKALNRSDSMVNASKMLGINRTTFMERCVNDMTKEERKFLKMQDIRIRKAPRPEPS